MVAKYCGLDVYIDNIIFHKEFLVYSNNHAILNKQKKTLVDEHWKIGRNSYWLFTHRRGLFS